MRAIILTWEFPPRIIGSLAHHVNRLAVELVKNKVDVYVVTYHDTWNGYDEGADGVKAYRVSNPVKAQISVISWDLSLNQEFARVASDIYYSNNRKINLIDAHDWHCVPAAVSLKKAFYIPFIFSVDSLEDHRSPGANTPFNLSIKGIERLGVHEADKIIVKSEWMKQEVSRIYNVPSERIDVVSPQSSSWISEVLKSYKKATLAPEDLRVAME